MARPKAQDMDYLAERAEADPEKVGAEGLAVRPRAIVAAAPSGAEPHARCGTPSPPWQT
jgi:hypothetical protein